MRRPLLIVLLVLFALPVPAARAAGLLAPNDQTLPPLRVTDHLVEVEVHDRIALTKVTQTFRNDTKRRLEATYIFPLPEDADLTDFQMTFNGKMTQGKVLPAEEAARIYESIVRQSKDPGLIEFIGRRLLQMRVFPIEPESDTTIQVRYQQVCPPVSGMRAYHYPLRTRKTSGQAYGTVRFNVALRTNAPLKSIWSPTHAVEIVRPDDAAGERSATIAYEATGGSLEDDFLLLFDTDASDVGLSAVTYKPNTGDDGHFVLLITPRQLWPEEDVQPQDVVFVIDTSGSMAGDKLDQAKSALKFCVDQLGEQDRFSIVRFSSGFDVLFETVRPATKDHRTEARAWIDAFRSGGGTNITDTLAHVVAMERERPLRETRPFVVVFLTDGRGNREPAQILDRLTSADGSAAAMRIFPFGVGHDVNTKLLDQLSASFAGRTTYVQPGENLELRLGDFFSVISRPVLTDLRLSLPEIGATERFPATLGDLYHGQQIVLAGKLAKPATGSVRLSATRSGKPVEYVWNDVAFTSTTNATYVPSVWAGRKIAFLIDQIRTHGESDEMIKEVLTLSQEYGIQTPYSSWLVNPEAVIAQGDVALNFARRTLGKKRGAPTAGLSDRVARRLGAPGGGGGGSGGGGGGFGMWSSDGIRGSEAVYGDGFDEIELQFAGKSVTESTGRIANLIARKNVELRELRTRDDGRLSESSFRFRRIEGEWYTRFGSVLVDQRFADDTELVVVRFASSAYFEIVRARPELRAVLAASRVAVVMVTKDTAVFVSDEAGLETLSDEEREQIGLNAG